MMHLKLALAAAFALTFTAITSASATIYNTLGGLEAGGDPLAAVGTTLGDLFVAGSNDTVRSLTFNLAATAPSSGSFFVAIDQVDPGFQLGDKTLTVLASYEYVKERDSGLTSGFALHTYALATPFALVQGDTYFVGVVEPTVTSALIFGNTLDPSVLDRPEVVTGATYFNNAGGVQANSGGPYELSVNTNAVPEPATLALFGLGGLALIARIRRTR